MTFDFTALKQNYDDKQYANCFPALKEVKSLLKQDPMQANLLAKIAWQAGNTRLERTILRWGVHQFPDNVEMLCGLAYAYYSSMRLIDAKDLLERAGKLAADDEERGKVWLYKSVFFSQMRLFTSAESCLHRARELLGPDKVLKEKGYFLLMQERIRESSACLQKAIAADPGREDVYMMLAYLKNLEQNWAGAKQWLEAGLQQSPQSLHLLYYLATAQWLLGEADAFEYSVARIVELNPEAEFIPALNWLQGINAYRREDWHRVKEILSQSIAAGGKDFALNLSTWNADVPWERVSLHLNPRMQRHNHCVPCAVSNILDYYGISVDQLDLGERLLDTGGTPMHNLYTWLEDEGYAFVAFRASQDQVKTALRNGIPVLMSLRSAAGAHVTIIYGFDDALQVFFLQDPGSLFPLPLLYSQYDETFANSFYEAVALVPAEDKDRLSPLLAWDEPQLRLLAQHTYMYNTGACGQAEIAAQVRALQRDKIYFSGLLIECKPQHVAEADFRLAVEQLWDAPQCMELFRLRVINALCVRGMFREASERMHELKGRNTGWFGLVLQTKMALYHEQNPEKALPLARKAVRILPASDESLALLGQTLMQLGEHSAAAEYLSWAVELQPERERLYASIGENYRRQGQYALAEENLRKALAMEPEDCWALEQLGLCYLDQRKIAEAQDCFRKAASLDPRRPWPYAYLAQIHEMQENYPEAINCLQLGLKATEGHPELLWEIGRILIERERYSQALSYLMKSTEKQDDPSLAAMIASCQLETGRQAEAVKTVEAALQKHPDSSLLHARYGHILEQTGQKEEALVHLGKAIELDPTYQWPFGLLLDLCREAKAPNRGRLVLENILVKQGPSENVLCYLGSLWEMEGDRRQAEALYRQAVQLNPGSTFPRCRLAELHRQEQRWAEAEKSFLKLLEHAGAPLEAYFSLADLYRQTDRLEEAMAMLQEVSGNKKNEPSFWNNLYSFLAGADRLQEFESFLPQLPPGRWHSTLLHARYLEEVGRTDEASELLESYLAANPEDLLSLNEVALHYEIHGHLQKAEEKWALSLQQDVTDKALAGLLRTLYNQGKIAAAEKLANAPRLTPQQKRDSYIRVGLWLYCDYRYPEAIPWFNTDFVLENAETYVYTCLADSYNKARQPDEAIATITKAYRLFPNNIDVLYWYGDILSDRGMWQAALPAYERLYEYYSDAEQKAYALSMQGYCLMCLGKHRDAQETLRRALALNSMEEFAATNIASYCLKHNKLSEALTILKPLVDAGKGLSMPCLLSNFLRAAFSLGLPGEQHWLDLARQRLQYIRTTGKAGPHETEMLHALAKELAVELGDEEAQKEVGPRNLFSRLYTKYSIWRRFASSTRLRWTGIVCALAFLSLLAFDNIYVDGYILKENMLLCAGGLLLCILTAFRRKWATIILAGIAGLVAGVLLILNLTVPVLQDYIKTKAYVEAGVFALQTAVSVIGAFSLVTLTTKTRDFLHLKQLHEI